MFNRESLKTNAKNILTKNYWYAFLVCIITGLLTGGLAGGMPMATSNFSFGNHDFSGYKENVPDKFLMIVIPIIIFFTLIAIAVSLGIQFFLRNPLQVGKNRYFLQSRKQESINASASGLSELIYPFKNEYLNIVKTIVLTDLIIWLWSLLLIIPGIYKAYQFFFVKYIAAENPKIDPKKARDLSVIMTDGYKLDLFVLQLSFIGWYILGSLLIIGGLFVNPYYEATLAEAYIVCRNNAVSAGKIDSRELFGY